MKSLKSVLYDQFYTVMGSLILALSINMFLAPNKISGGGVGTIATIFLHLFEFKMSITNMICNIVLFFLGYKFLGKYAIVKTISGILSLSVFLELTYYLPKYTEDITIATIVGGVLMGIGVGLAVRCGASTGGSDFAALMVKKYLPHVSIANIILVIDTIIIAISGIVFHSFTITVYSVVALYVSSIVTDAVFTVGDAAKGIYIISAEYEKVSAKIMNDLERGVTGISCTGMYTHNDGKMLYCVVSPKELSSVIKLIKAVDDSSFIVITDAREVIGEGFKIDSAYNNS